MKFKSTKFIKKISKKFLKWPSFLALIICGVILFTYPAKSQDFYLTNYLPELNIKDNLLSAESENKNMVSGCIRIDGRCQFQIASPPNELDARIEIIQRNLREILKTYFDKQNVDLEVTSREVDNLYDIYINIDGKETRLMTVTSWDAEIDGTNIQNKAQLITVILNNSIPVAKEERTIKFLTQQAVISVIIVILSALLQLAISRLAGHLNQSKKILKDQEKKYNEPIQTQLTNRKNVDVKEIQERLLQLLGFGIWFVSILFILGLFPYTRFLQTLLINWVKVPIRIIIVSVLTYLLIRLTYALIHQFSGAIINDFAITPASNQRLQLRVKTIANIVRSVATIAWVAAGFIVGLSLIGVDIGPILAGLGIFSLALSLGSQNLIKDAINGFFIILEDQYAVGDVINVNDVGGFVENMNLRITQLRDAEGRLITIPNSEVKIVANLSSQWARADLNIPIAYDVDVDKAIKVITEVANQMSNEEDWKYNIIDQPEILGVDNFGDRGLIIKVWIKTQPLKQWLVSREFRRRLVIALTEAGIPIPAPQQEILFDHNSLKQKKANILNSKSN